MTKSHPSSSQTKEMADESMVRNLAAQAEAIWPQEEPIFERNFPRGSASVIDIGCGTGELTARLAAKYPAASFIGIDLEEPHLERARERCQEFGERVRFEKGDALALSFEDESFDFAVCRHLVQAVPDARGVVSEIRRVLRPGGAAHIIAEDYGMLWAYPTELDADDFWQRVPHRYAAAIGCDLQIGRKMFTILHDLGMTDIHVDYVVVDPLRVDRDVFARIWEAWRDGYSESLAEHGGMSREEVGRRWAEMIACVRDERGYALWQVPVWTARKAAR
jgi:SAM-dependent methyltransferase